MIDQLVKIGLTKHEAEVYLTLLQSGPTGAGEIIKRTSIHRNIVYETLDRLTEKGLVFEFKKQKISQFQVTDPQRILDQVKGTLSLAEEIVPKLAAVAGVKQDIVVWEGIEGFRAFNFSLLERMKDKDTFYVIGSVGDLWYELMGEDLNKWLRRWGKKKTTGKSVIYKKAEKDSLLSRYETRVIPFNFEPPADLVIWGDIIAHQCLVEPYSVIEIKNPILAKAYLAYFELLWNRAR